MQISYDEIAQQLQIMPVTFSTSECHGVVTGLAITSSHIGELNIAEYILSETDHQHALALEQQAWLNQWLGSIVEELNDSDLSFMIAIPDEQQALANRLAAVAEWCQGFLYGLAALGETDFETLPAEASETLSDLSEIGKMDFENADDGDDAEADLFEITEYIRMATLSLFDDISAQKKLQSTQKALDKLIH